MTFEVDRYVILKVSTDEEKLSVTLGHTECEDEFTSFNSLQDITEKCEEHEVLCPNGYDNRQHKDK